MLSGTLAGMFSCTASDISILGFVSLGRVPFSMDGPLNLQPFLATSVLGAQRDKRTGGKRAWSSDLTCYPISVGPPPLPGPPVLCLKTIGFIYLVFPSWERMWFSASLHIVVEKTWGMYRLLKCFQRILVMESSSCFIPTSGGKQHRII